MSDISRLPRVYNGMLKTVRVLIADSVFETAVISVRDGWMTIEFESRYIDNISVPLMNEVSDNPSGSLTEGERLFLIIALNRVNASSTVGQSDLNSLKRKLGLFSDEKP